MLGMMWFGNNWGYYIPLALYVGCIGVFYVMLIGGYIYEGMRDVAVTITAFIGIICIAIPHLKRITDGSSGFTFEYLGYMALITMSLYPYVVKSKSA